MIYQALSSSNQAELVELFSSVFSASEGEQEGAMLRQLTSQLAALIDEDAVMAFGAYEEGILIGTIFFSRLQFDSPVSVYMLSPVAVATEQQGQGVGQALIRYGLEALKERAVEVAITYGDPAFYSKVGFAPLSEELIQAPMELSMPFGWLGQSLSEKPLPKLSGRPVCVEPFNAPNLW